MVYNALANTCVTTAPVAPIVYTGQWLPNTIYAQNNAAYYLGSEYISLVPANQGQAPDTSPGSWSLLLSNGGGSGSGINQLTGAVTAGPATGSTSATITPTGVTAGTYTFGSLQVSVNAAGQILAIGSAPPPPTPVTITSFTGPSGTVELGTHFVNPAFSATYTGSPTSASITNTDGIGTPQALASPYTSGTVTGTFTHAAVASTTFTLTTGSQTATLALNWQPAIFGGMGASDATSTITATGTTAVLSTGDALARVQLGAESVGQTFGPFSPSGQVVYLLLTGGSHSFIDANTGFPFSFNAPVAVGFVNVNGVTVPLYLYASTNPLTGTFAPKVTS